MYRMHIGTIIVRVGSSTVPAIGLGSQAYRREVLPYGLYALQYASKIDALYIKFCVHIGQIFGVYRAEFECKIVSLIRRLYMQNAVVFNIYCM